MADKNSGWACTANVSVVAETNLTATIRVICYWQNQGWRYDMNNVSAWVYCNGTAVCVKDNGSIDTTGNNQGAYEMGRYDFVVNKTTSTQSIPFCAKITSTSSYVSGTKWSGDTYINVAAKPSHTVSYNANGGSGAPSSQTKWYGSILTLSSSKPSRTGYTFQGWATSSGGSVAYQPGGSYGADANVTLYAVWKANTYTVSYNANGGSGAPAAQTKTYGVNLTLSSTKPTRTNYNFKGWSTSSTATTATYAAGGTYTNNSAITLYAVWELAYVKPRITSFKAQRCTSDGTASESGTYVKVTFNWATDKTVSAVVIQAKSQSATNWSSVTVTASGTSGSVSQIIGEGGVSTETSYHVRAYVSDSGGTTYSTQVSIGTVKYPIDVRAGGKGVAFGKVAEKDDFIETAWPIHSAQTFNRASWNTPTKGLLTQVTDNSGNQHSVIVGLKSDGSSRLYGIDLIDSDTIPSMRLYAGSRYLEISTNTKSFTTETGTIRPGVSLYNSSTGTGGTVTLSETANNFNFMEIYYKVTRGGTTYYGCEKVYGPNSKTVAFNLLAQYTDSGVSKIAGSNSAAVISGTSITRKNSGEWENSTTGIGFNTNNAFSIVRVEGYR